MRCDFDFQGGQDIMSMMGQLMKPKKTEITGINLIVIWCLLGVFIVFVF